MKQCRVWVYHPNGTHHHKGKCLSEIHHNHPGEVVVRHRRSVLRFCLYYPEHQAAFYCSQLPITEVLRQAVDFRVFNARTRENIVEMRIEQVIRNLVEFFLRILAFPF